MNRTLGDAALASASQVIETRLGLHFPATRWNELERGLLGAARELGRSPATDLLDWLSNATLTSHDIDILASHLTIGETYFFRERATFEALETHILPGLLSRTRANRRLRIWCAGCCTGEEPYSIAMLLEGLLPDIDDWNLQILATDINPQFLGHAAHGRYKQWSFRESGADLQRRFFTQPEPGCYVLNPRTRARVTFAPLNLAEDTYPSLLNHTGAMDLILCRNVLMYFTRDVIEQVIGRFYRCLADNGHLIVSVTETSQELFRQFQTLHINNAVFYRKSPPGRQTPGATGAIPKIDVAPATAPRAAPPVRQRQTTSPAVIRPATPSPKTVVEAEPNKQALALYRAGRYEDAEQLVSRLLEEHQSATLLALRAQIAANQGRLAQALQWCDRSLAMEKLNPLHHHLRASILEELGRSDEAMSDLRKALYLDPDFVLAHFMLGHLAWRRQQVAQARKHFANVLTLLEGRAADEELAEFDGLTTGRLAELTRTLTEAVA